MLQIIVLMGTTQPEVPGRACQILIPARIRQNKIHVGTQCSVCNKIAFIITTMLAILIY